MFVDYYYDCDQGSKVVRILKKMSVWLVFGILCTGCGGGGGGSSVTQPTGPTLPASVSIDIFQALTSTGIPVTAGETITVSASGTLDYSTGQTCEGSPCDATPAGTPVSSCKGLTGFYAPSLPCWSLIGRIGTSGSVFEVGTSYTATAATSGELYLGLNDNVYTDNGGTWNAVVNVSQS